MNNLNIRDRINKLSDNELLQRGFSKMDIELFRSGYKSPIDAMIDMIEYETEANIGEEEEKLPEPKYFSRSIYSLHGDPTDKFPMIDIKVYDLDPSRISFGLEYIIGWPGFEAFPKFMQRVRSSYYGTSNTPETLHKLKAEIINFLYELQNRGALSRDNTQNGAWRYGGKDK